MPSRLASTVFFTLATTSALFAESRSWKSADGVRTVQGEFVKRDAGSVTIRSNGDKELVIDLPKLHADERKWLEVNHPVQATSSGPAVADSAAFFDTLTFDDTRETALAKLKASKVVEMTTDETFIGRSGLNGVFRTRQKIGELSSFLYFDWSESGKLTELNVQTEPQPASAYKTQLEPSWTQFIELLSTLYGKAVQKGPLPSLGSLTDGMFAPSHVWNIESGGCAMLGTACEGKKYQVVVRFTQKRPQLVEIP
jgi:hypothetical protein